MAAGAAEFAQQRFLQAALGGGGKLVGFGDAGDAHRGFKEFGVFGELEFERGFSALEADAFEDPGAGAAFDFEGDAPALGGGE